MQAREEGGAVVALVGEHRIGLDLSGQGFGPGDVMGLPAGQAEGDGKPERIDDGMDFGREPTARATYGLVEAPFLRAPALCWWARTIVASIIAYSLSGSSAKVLKRLSQTPFAAQRENRV